MTDNERRSDERLALRSLIDPSNLRMIENERKAVMNGGKSTDLDPLFGRMNKNERLVQDLVISEQERRRKRFQAHNNNTVWKKRAQPPPDWNKPLPDWMEMKYKDTYLYHKSKEQKSGENNKSPQANRTLCVIS
uniref:Uncharacterized protein n=1 Tax=Timema genevievae TaxID=629358 RepID=A0A7R9PJ79_TIMGE|nr:unnamed protein product [Timema genevievae]